MSLDSFSDVSSKLLSRSLRFRNSTLLCFSRTSASSLVSFSVCLVAVSIMTCAALMPALPFLLIEFFGLTFPSLRRRPTPESFSLMLVSCSLRRFLLQEKFVSLLSLTPLPAFFWQLHLSLLLLLFSLSLLLFYPPQVFSGRQNIS